MAENPRYHGPERRTDQCFQCETEQYKSCVNAHNIEQIKENCEKTKTSLVKELGNKIPMWGLIPMLTVLIGIFLIQWATYEKVNVWVGSTSERVTRLEEQMKGFGK